MLLAYVRPCLSTVLLVLIVNECLLICPHKNHVVSIITILDVFCVLVQNLFG